MTPRSQPVPIAFCITELDRGGAELALCQLVLGLDRQSWLPRVYCLGPHAHFVDRLEAGGVAVECFGARGLVSLPRVLVQLALSLRRFRPAILQTFLFHANLLGRVAGRLARVPHIISGIRVADRHNRWHGRLDRWTNWMVDHNVCVSQGVADFAIRETGIPPHKLSVIPNGVDYELFASASPADRVSLGIPADCRVIITVGRLEEQKGIPFLLHAAAIVCAAEPNCQFLIVGDGPDRDDLLTLAERLHVTSNVQFLANRSDVPNLLTASDVFVLPSLWEGMPNALLEAMAAGLPVIATDVEGSRELVCSGVNGLLVPPSSAEALGRAIRSLLGDIEMASSMRIKSQSTVRTSFAPNITTHAYDSLYRSVLGVSQQP